MSGPSQRLRNILIRNRAALGLDTENLSDNEDLIENENFSFSVEPDNSLNAQEELVQLLNNLSLDSNQFSDTSKMENLRFHSSLLPTFSGNQDHLESFIISIDEFYSLYSTTEDQKKLVLAAIKFKLIDDAKNFLLSRPDLTTWTSIKDALRQKFGDPITYPILLQQLQYTKINKDENILEFVERLKTFVQRITSKIQCEVQDQQSKLLLINQVEKTSVLILTANSPQTLKTMLMLQGPDKLNDALKHVLNYNMIESQVNFSNNHSTLQNVAPKHQNNYNRYKNKSLNNVTYPPTNYYLPNPPQKFPSQPIFVQPQQVRRHFPTNAQVFGNQATHTQANNRAPPKDTPTPMTISTAGPSRVQQQKQPPFRYPNPFQATGPPNFAAQELSNVEVLPEISYNPYDMGQPAASYQDTSYYPQTEENNYYQENYNTNQSYLDFNSENQQNPENDPENFWNPASKESLT